MRIHTRLAGIRIFHPSAMNWSSRKRGSVPRNQMKPNNNVNIFARNHSTGHQPWFSALLSISESGHGARQPPRNSVVANAETVVMLMYSARKNIANLIDAYSVWNPPTSSPSASGRSNGARFVSPTIAIRYMTNDGKSGSAYQRLCCADTISDVDSDPA